jgi:GNAT superfamily N-acetyltransferase
MACLESLHVAAVGAEGSLAAMLEIEMLPASAAEDAVVVTDLSTLVNRAYRVAEQGLWTHGVARTTPAETAAAAALAELAVAREQGRLVGSIRTRQIDSETGWFGALAVDPAYGGHGIGGKLVRFVEIRAMSAGARTMQLELLVPLEAHAHTERLAAWYGRLGYQEAERRELEEFEPTAVPFLAVPLEVAVMRKPLASPDF